jgi:hypothetical protein
LSRNVQKFFLALVTSYCLFGLAISVAWAMDYGWAHDVQYPDDIRLIQVPTDWTTAAVNMVDEFDRAGELTYSMTLGNPPCDECVKITVVSSGSFYRDRDNLARADPYHNLTKCTYYDTSDEGWKWIPGRCNTTDTRVTRAYIRLNRENYTKHDFWDNVPPTFPSKLDFQQHLVDHEMMHILGARNHAACSYDSVLEKTADNCDPYVPGVTSDDLLAIDLWYHTP